MRLLGYPGWLLRCYYTVVKVPGLVARVPGVIAMRLQWYPGGC